MNIKHLLSLSALIALFFLASCGSDDENTLPSVSNVLVVNEGNFLSANGSLSDYAIETGAVRQGVHEASATIQKALQNDGLLYLVTNAPDQLQILNASDLSTVATVSEGLLNPVGVAVLGNRAFVSNWGDINTAFGDSPDAFISVVDLRTNMVVDSILLDKRPQGIIAAGDRIYVALEGGSAIAHFNPGDTEITLSEIATNPGPSNMIVDMNGNIWVLCTSGNLTEIITADNTVGRNVPSLTTGGFNEKLAYTNIGHVIYFLGGTNDSFSGNTTVYAVELAGNAPLAQPFLEDGFSLYGIGVNPEDAHVFVADNNGFQSTGTCLIIDETGAQTDSFATGIGPNGFLFQ